MRPSTPGGADAASGMPSTRHRRALQQIQEAHRSDLATAAHQNKSRQEQPPQQQQQQQGTQLHLQGANKENPHLQDIGYFLASSARSQQQSVAEDEEADTLASLTSRSADGASTPLRSFVPVPLPQPRSTPAQVTQRATRESGPASGRLGESRTGRSLFPGGGEASIVGVDVIRSSGGAGGSGVDVTLLHHGLAQILSTKESAKRYIELMRKKMYQYMVLNKEYANTHASEQLRNRGILSLKKTLTLRIDQMNLLQKNIQKQLGKKEDDARARVEAVQLELRTLQQAHAELTQSHRDAIRSAQDTAKEHDRAVEKIRNECEMRIDESQRELRANESQLQSALSQSNSENAKLREQIDSMEEETSQLKMQLRMQQMAPVVAAPTDNTVERNQRLEIALENACNEVERLQAECQETKASLSEAIGDIHKLVESHGRIKRAHTKLAAEQQIGAQELETVSLEARQSEIELDEARDISSAYQRAYESTLVEKVELERGLAQLIGDFELLRGNLCELMIEQSGTIPLPLQVLDSNPELGILLSSAGVEADGDDDSASVQSRHISTPPLSPSTRSLLTHRSGHRDRESSESDSSAADLHAVSMASLDDSLASLNLSQVSLRSSASASPRASPRVSSATTSRDSRPYQFFTPSPSARAARTTSYHRGLSHRSSLAVTPASTHSSVRSIAHSPSSERLSSPHSSSGRKAVASRLDLSTLSSPIPSTSSVSTVAPLAAQIRAVNNLART